MRALRVLTVAVCAAIVGLGAGCFDPGSDPYASCWKDGVEGTLRQDFVSIERELECDAARDVLLEEGSGVSGGGGY